MPRQKKLVSDYEYCKRIADLEGDIAVLEERLQMKNVSKQEVYSLLKERKLQLARIKLKYLEFIKSKDLGGTYENDRW